MTIDDELIRELIKPNKLGKAEGRLIRKVVDISDFQYTLEELVWFTHDFEHRTKNRTVGLEKQFIICPDLIITIPRENNRQIAIEIENDIKWDFGQSLRQVKKYRLKFPDTRIIIPEDYQRFAALYKNEGFRVFLWKAKRLWQCLRCSSEIKKEGPIVPRCNGCNNHSQNDFRLIGLKETTIEEFTD